LFWVGVVFYEWRVFLRKKKKFFFSFLKQRDFSNKKNKNILKWQIFKRGGAPFFIFFY